MNQHPNYGHLPSGSIFSGDSVQKSRQVSCVVLLTTPKNSSQCRDRDCGDGNYRSHGQQHEQTVFRGVFRKKCKDTPLNIEQKRRNGHRQPNRNPTHQKSLYEKSNLGFPEGSAFKRRFFQFFRILLWKKIRFFRYFVSGLAWIGNANLSTYLESPDIVRRAGTFCPKVRRSRE